MGAKRGRPTIHDKPMTAAERKRRSREMAKLRMEERRRRWASRNEPAESRDPVFLARKAYVTLLTPLERLAEITEREGGAAALLDQMEAGQRQMAGRVARRALAVVELLAALPDDERTGSGCGSGHSIARINNTTARSK